MEIITFKSTNLISNSSVSFAVRSPAFAEAMAGKPTHSPISSIPT